MAEMRVVVQLSEAEYQTLLADLTDVLDNEKDPRERDRKLRMLLQHRGYMTSGYDDDNWKLPAREEAKSAPKSAAKSRAKSAATRAPRKAAAGKRKR